MAGFGARCGHKKDGKPEAKVKGGYGWIATAMDIGAGANSWAEWH